MQRTTWNTIVFGVLTLALALTGCGDDGKGGGGGVAGGGGASFDGADSPHELIEAARPHAESNNWRALMGMIAPDDRPVMAFMGIFMAKMIPAMSQMAVQFAQDENAKKEAQAKLDALNAAIDGVMGKHNVDLDKIDDEKAQSMMAGGEPDVAKVRAFFKENFPGLDAGAFLSDVFAVIEKHGDPKQTESMSMSEGFKGKLENVKVDGDRATGTVDDDEVHFVKVAGRWYIDMGAMMSKK